MEDLIPLRITVGDEQYYFLVGAAKHDQLANVLGNFAFNPDLNFTPEHARRVLKQFDERVENETCCGREYPCRLRTR